MFQFKFKKDKDGVDISWYYVNEYYQNNQHVANNPTQTTIEDKMVVIYCAKCTENTRRCPRIGHRYRWLPQRYDACARKGNNCVVVSAIDERSDENSNHHVCLNHSE